MSHVRFSEALNLNPATSSSSNTWMRKPTKPPKWPATADSAPMPTLKRRHAGALKTALLVNLKRSVSSDHEVFRS